MDKKYLIVLLGILGITFSLFSFGKIENNTVEEPPPNIILIFLDDAFNDFQPFGVPRYATPEVAKLAEEGTSVMSNV